MSIEEDAACVARNIRRDANETDVAAIVALAQAAVMAERDRCFEIARDWRDGNVDAVAAVQWTARQIANAIIKPTA